MKPSPMFTILTGDRCLWLYSYYNYFYHRWKQQSLSGCFLLLDFYLYRVE